MRTPRPEVNGKARLIAGLVVTGLLLSVTLADAVTKTSSPPGSATSPTNQTQAPAATPVAVIRFSPGIPDIIQMVEAKVDPQVIKTYIKNSTVAYNPSAAELIFLKNRGVPEDVLTALVERGGQVKAQARQVTPSRPAPPVPSAYPYSYPYAYPAYAGGYPGYPAYAYGGYPYYPYPLGPLVSFNNSYPTYINGYPVYSGYYAPGYGYLW